MLTIGRTTGEMSYNPCYLVCANSLIGVEQVAGVGPAFKHWQCLVITDILYLHKLVGRERLELPVFLVLRVYIPLPSPLGIPAQIKWHAVQESNPYLVVRSHPFFPLN